jgi:hypothetical protein
MARKPKPQAGNVDIDLGRPNSSKQERFFDSRVKYTCYGVPGVAEKAGVPNEKPLAGA